MEHLVSTTHSDEEVAAALAVERHGRTAPVADDASSPTSAETAADAGSTDDPSSLGGDGSALAADGSGDDGEPAGEIETDPKPDKRRSFAARTAARQAEMAALTKQREALTQEIADLEAKKAAAAKAAEPESTPHKTGEEEGAAAPSSVADHGLTAPNADDFDTTEEYLKAERDYAVKLAVAEARAAAKKELEDARAAEAKTENETKAQDAAKAALQKYTERRQALIDGDVPDYQARLDAAHEAHPDLTLTDDMLREVTDSEVGPQIVLHLAENPDECRKIMTASSPRDVIRSIWQIEQQLVGAKNPPGSPPATPVTKAKPPTKPVGASRTTPPVSLEKIPMQDYIAKRREQRAARAGVR